MQNRMTPLLYCFLSLKTDSNVSAIGKLLQINTIVLNFLARKNFFKQGDKQTDRERVSPSKAVLMFAELCKIKYRIMILKTNTSLHAINITTEQLMFYHKHAGQEDNSYTWSNRLFPPIQSMVSLHQIVQIKKTVSSFPNSRKKFCRLSITYLPSFYI